MINKNMEKLEYSFVILKIASSGDETIMWRQVDCESTLASLGWVTSAYYVRVVGID